MVNMESNVFESELHFYICCFDQEKKNSKKTKFNPVT